MDIQEILDQKLKGMPSGPHVDGLRAVKSHIEAAARHFRRGQTDADETLFTDVIFRCNQAFEGSIKEAYRVLAGADPRRTTPAEIEKFLASANLLRKKVLDQFTTYRRDWRNPSTHDYTLDFDEDEALLAIVSVTVFAIVLCDQIDGKLAFDAAASGQTAPLSASEKEAPLLELVSNKALLFATTHTDTEGPTRSPAHDYYRLEGALAGYLAAELAGVPKLSVIQGREFADREADIVVQRATEIVIVELKRRPSKINPRIIVRDAVTRASSFLHENEVVGAVVLLYSMTNRSDYEISNATGVLADRIKIVAPRSNKDSSL